MYRRFLNNNDYLSIITQEALHQLTRGEDERFAQAEESAEISILEYLSENYEIEAEFHKGKFTPHHDRKITFPVGAHIYYDGRIHQVTRSMSGYKVPTLSDYWQEHVDITLDPGTVQNYSQFNTYYLGDLTIYNDVVYYCLIENGYNFSDIRIPLVNGWVRKELDLWEPMQYNTWDVVSYNGDYYTLLTTEGFDNNVNPFDSDCWGMIADYDPEYNEYDLTGHDYVVYNGVVMIPQMDVNSDVPITGHNITLADPRSYNLKKHMVRLALYELTKSVAPNNVSMVRMRDYEDSMKWLNDASKLRLNPQIPRKLSEKDNKPVSDWQLSTFQTDYNPHNNPWLI